MRAGGRHVPGDRRQRHARRSQHAGALPAWTALPVRTRGAGLVHRQRNQRRARLRPRQHQPQAAHQGRVPPRDLRERPDSGPPRPLRHQGGAALPARSAGGWLGRATPAVHGQADAGRAHRGRRDHRRAQGRGRRVLRPAGPARRHRRRAARAAPRAGGAPVDQADLPIRRCALARRRRSGAAAAGVAAHDPQQPLAPPELDAGDVDARQMGVPVVRRLGPRVPVRAVRAGRREVRQGSALDASVRAIPAPKRAAAGLRVGVRRSQPAGPRVGGVAGLQHGSDPQRPRRPRRGSSAASTSS